jgi:hypothetical protein
MRDIGCSSEKKDRKGRLGGTTADGTIRHSPRMKHEEDLHFSIVAAAVLVQHWLPLPKVEFEQRGGAPHVHSLVRLIRSGLRITLRVITGSQTPSPRIPLLLGCVTQHARDIRTGPSFFLEVQVLPMFACEKETEA